ncbi:MAG: UPF0489 family protein [Deltaproteobacteria bacterium]|nr:UPF0489 family protein [Deltaproteobacteria bacterium]MCB9487910.1 UPF0489 family protein [Deltaproteobacteria bacterium]
MVIVSVDIDFFVNPFPKDSQDCESDIRLPASEYCVAPDATVADLLRRCGLESPPKVSGVFIANHEFAFDIIKTLSLREQRKIELIHVDAHADIGFPEASFRHILMDLSYKNLTHRRNPERGADRLNCGSWLTYAILAEFIESICFVPKYVVPQDLYSFYFSKELTCDNLESEFVISKIDNSIFSTYLRHGISFANDTKRALLKIPFKIVRSSELAISKKPDFVIVCQSPPWTPLAADRILDICRQYIMVDPLQRNYQGPKNYDLPLPE